MSSGYENALRGSGPYVQIEAVAWLPETAEHDTPEFLLDALREARAKRVRDDLHGHLGLIPTREALAIMLHEGLFGHDAIIQAEVARYIGASSQQAVSYVVRRAKVRIKYLLTRPAIDTKKLASVLSASQLQVVVDVFHTASFAEVARRRWTCPEGLDRKQRRQWTRNKSTRVKRNFFFALAKVERSTLTEQAEALRHLVEHLGVLSYHEGKKGPR